MTIPKGSATGAWRVTLFPLDDTLGNTSAGFQTLATLTVTGTPSRCDRARDGQFHGRAQVTEHRHGTGARQSHRALDRRDRGRRTLRDPGPRCGRGRAKASAP